MEFVNISRLQAVEQYEIITKGLLRFDGTQPLLLIC